MSSNNLRRNMGEIRSPVGTDLNALSWATEAPLRMLMNNLDPDVAERPEELLSTAGSDALPATGIATKPSWSRLKRLKMTKPFWCRAGWRFRTRRRAPRADRQFQHRRQLGDAGSFHQARPDRADDVRPDDRGVVDLHQQGDRAGNVRNVRRGRAPAFQWRPHDGPDRSWHGWCSAACGDDGRRQHDRRRMPAKPDRIPHADWISNTKADTLEEALAIVENSHADGKPVSVDCSVMRLRSIRRSCWQRAAGCRDRSDVGA